MIRRREALGRNRQGPTTRNMVPTTVFLVVLLAGAGFFAFRYFTQPQRVFGTKVLNCSATEIQWAALDGRPNAYLITGCGREIRAVCRPGRACVDPSTPLVPGGEG